MTSTATHENRKAGKQNDVDDSDAAQEQSPLQGAVERLLSTVTDRALATVSDKVQNASGRLTEYAGGGGNGLLAAVTGAQKLAEGKSPVKAALSGGWAGAKQVVKDKATSIKETITGGKGRGGGGKKLKVTNIVESIDVGVPVQVAYDQWTQFADFPKFMKKLEQVEQISDEKLRWKGQVFWSHRSWESTILEQVRDERIVWRSKGDKGYIDGAVTFHELTPDLTRILVVLEYKPQGFFEKTGNIWRAPGRRMRLELKHFQRHVMTQTILHQEELEGWPGEIRDGKVVDPDEENPDEADSGEEDTGAERSESQSSDEPDETDEEFSDEKPSEKSESSDRSEEVEE